MRVYLTVTNRSDNIWDYENNRDMFIIIVMVMIPLYNHDCVILRMKNSDLVVHYSLLQCVPATLGTSNTTSHIIKYHHYRLYTKWLLQHITSLKDFIQLVCTKYGHYMIIVIVLTIVIYVCSRIVIPRNLTTIAHLVKVLTSNCLQAYN